jgi:ubiquinone/menaquinone biosynthesis C-methylase UbiE
VRNLLDQAPTRDLHGIHAHAARLAAGELASRDVLDIGCGFGWFELLALDCNAASVVGLEPSEADLVTARKHVSDECVSFVVGSAIELPFADQSFDVVVCWEVLEHLPAGTESQAFAQFHRVLRPGGLLYLSTPYASLRARALDPAWWLIGHRHYSTDDLERLVRDVGFEVELLEVRGGGWLLASILDLYIAKWLFRRAPFFESAVNRRVDRELQRPTGYANCFLKARRHDSALTPETDQERGGVAEVDSH